ncbi:mycofactocin-coupled SDR family oxidoreductase [Leptolyngbya sp. FACHB-261]|nr:mycofactocin-coupled SDR family oxidoreductase [Leptolyngbya sp. FACHB-261]
MGISSAALGASALGATVNSSVARATDSTPEPVAQAASATVAQNQGQPTRNNKPLSGQVAIVTGAARGIGRAVAVRLAKEGADVAICDIAGQITSVPYPLAKSQDMAETIRLVEAQGVRALSVQADVRSRQQMENVVKRTIDGFGKVDILVANAGVLTFGWLHEMSDAEWDDVIAVNLSGVAKSMQAVIPHMRERRYGRIVVINSCNSRFGSAQSASYNASKWGVLGLVKCAAVEYAKEGITVNAINPTGVRTPMIINEATLTWADPKNPSPAAIDNYLRNSLNAQDVGLIEPEDVAAGVPFFCSPDAYRVTGEAMDIAAGANVRWNS